MQPKKWALLAGAVSGLGLAALLVYGLVAQTQSTAKSGRDKAPDFEVTLFTGKEVNLSDFRGQSVVLNFWGSWCPPCRAEMPAFERVWKQYQGQGVVFVGVAVQDTERDARKFLEEIGLTYMVGLDASGDIATKYSLLFFPTTVFISKDGQVIKRWEGSIDEKNLLSWVEKIL